MKDIVKKLNYILDRKQKIHLCILAVMLFIGGLLETLSVSALLPVVWMIIDPVKAVNNRIVQAVMQLLGIQDVSSLMIPLLVGMVFMYIFKNLFLLALANEQSRFICYNRNKIINTINDCTLFYKIS